ncbi:phosphate ABC transporter substrate-binding protein [Ferruginivarius sediminum]|uniref:Phosphate ABC transporter substrate-binding protein n=1 Tax=Ferruginivarius sediminum TaxID=2661937 RepID=A0A369TF26_9PROT|nr:phosphate ABC transporter substrate-binding protein [Ferruginivarius sediminum]RDD62975.1 phosphate ABC transporter substrate-binding protein [Ferruginivarius sediminum]
MLGYRIKLAAVALPLLALTVSAIQAKADETRLLLTGSSTIAPIAEEIAHLYEEKNQDVRIDIQTGGSTKGVIDQRRGLNDIAMVSRRLKPSESDLTAHTFALDGLAMIVHEDNAVEDLSSDDIRAIYTRKKTDWSDFGDDGGEIIIINKSEGRATLDLFLDHFGLIPPDIKPHMVIGENEQGIKAVAGNRSAIGYVAISTAFYDAEHGVAIKLVGLDGVLATVENVANGSYPAIRQLNLVTAGEVSKTTQAFLDFAQSEAVHEILDTFHVVAPSR